MAEMQAFKSHFAEQVSATSDGMTQTSLAACVMSVLRQRIQTSKYIREESKCRCNFADRPAQQRPRYYACNIALHGLFDLVAQNLKAKIEVAQLYRGP